MFVRRIIYTLRAIYAVSAPVVDIRVGIYIRYPIPQNLPYIIPEETPQTAHSQKGKGIKNKRYIVPTFNFSPVFIPSLSLEFTCFHTPWPFS